MLIFETSKQSKTMKAQEKAFQEGQKAWNEYCQSSWKLKPENLYKDGSVKFKEWRRGWNLNFKGIK